MKTTKWFSLAALCLASGAYSAQAQKLPVDPAVTTGRLKNGFTYYIRNNQVQKGRVTLYLANKVGSVLEEDNQRGLAHFMEHMSFNGSKNFPGGKLVDFLEKAGVRFGADLNAYTSFDETIYQLPIPIDEPGMLKSGLQVIRDWAAEATLDPLEIDKERGVVLEEKRLREGGSQRMYEKSFPMLLNYSRYAYRMPIGTDQVLKGFKPEDVRSFYKDWYRPDLQAIIVVGDVNVKEVKEAIEKMFSDLKNPAIEKKRPVYGIELTGKNQFIALTDKEEQQTSLQLYIKQRSHVLDTYQDYNYYVARNLFNLLLYKRFLSVSQKNAGNYQAASANLGPLMANLDAFVATVSARPGELEKGFLALWKEINDIKTVGFTATELEEAKVQYLAGIKASLKEKDNQKSDQYAQEYSRNFIQGEAIPGSVLESELGIKAVNGLSLSDINFFARNCILDVNRDVIINAPEDMKSSLPDEKTFDSWIAKTSLSAATSVQGTDASTLGRSTGAAGAAVPENMSSSTGIKAVASATDFSKIKPQNPVYAQSGLLKDMPKAGKIISEKKIAEIGVTELVLSNGLRVILKPTTFRSDEIAYSAFSPGGSSLYPDRDFFLASNAASMVSLGGVGEFSEDELRSKLNGKQASAGVYIAERFEGAYGGSNLADLETALQLNYLRFTQPRKDDQAFTATMERYRSALSVKDNSPERVFNDTLSSVLSSGNIRRRAMRLTDLEQISLEQSFEIYKERFSNASDFTFVIVGSFEVDKIKPLLEQYLGSLPSTSRKESSKDLGIILPHGKIQKTVYSGTADKATVQLVISGDYSYSAENNLTLRMIKFVLGLRLIERLREQEGGVYVPSVSLDATRTPSRYGYYIRFGCAPANVEKLIAATWDEIEKLKENGPSPDDLSKFIAEEKVAFKNEQGTNNFWLSYLTGQYQEGLDPKQMLGFTSRLDALNKDAVKKAISRYLGNENYIRLVLMPQSPLSDKK